MVNPAFGRSTLNRQLILVSPLELQTGCFLGGAWVTEDKSEYVELVVDYSSWQETTKDVHAFVLEHLVSGSPVNVRHVLQVIDPLRLSLVLYYHEGSCSGQGWNGWRAEATVLAISGVDLCPSLLVEVKRIDIVEVLIEAVDATVHEHVLVQQASHVVAALLRDHVGEAVVDYSAALPSAAVQVE